MEFNKVLKIPLSQKERYPAVLRDRRKSLRFETELRNPIAIYLQNTFISKVRERHIAQIYQQSLAKQQVCIMYWL